jgi:uncharacterized 2Fe-2S/4Fe-4S cluster protein (DUF4445 family)
MAEHKVTFESKPPVLVLTGTLLAEAAKLSGVEISQPCGGQGRCGRCSVKVLDGGIRRRSALRLTPEDITKGYALACQTVVEGDVQIIVPPQEKVSRRLTTDRTVAEVVVPSGYDPISDQTVRRIPLSIIPPSMEDQTDDWSRLQTTLRRNFGVSRLTASLQLIRNLGKVLRDSSWEVTAIIDTGFEAEKTYSGVESGARLVDLIPGFVPNDEPLWGAAIDIGTTTVTVWLVDLLNGKVHAQVAEYNGQIARGEDVISRIIFASKNNGRNELRALILGTINDLLKRASNRARTVPKEIVKATIAGNSTMMHLFLGIPAESIRLSPFVTTVNDIPILRSVEVGLEIHPEATIDCLPGIASYVGADITAGVLSSGMDDNELTSLFIDVGTNGEIVLGTKDWLVTCACSAGPAFEGAGVANGMRATKGAIEEVWINSNTYEPTYRVMGNVKQRGIRGSGLTSLLAELFLTGLLDKGGNFNTSLSTNRIRQGAHGSEYVIAWADETSVGQDIVLTHVDVDNLIRAKAAIFAGFTVLSDSVGVPLETVNNVLIGGAFGKYINVEKAVEIGLLPDFPWDKFNFLGNTSVKGAYQALLDRTARARINDIALRMTYVELSADNSFYEAFTSALFLPHTDLTRFPSIQPVVGNKKGV